MAVFYNLFGALGSPYSVKMRAVLRYRQIPHLWIAKQPDVSDALAQVKVPVIPVLEYPDGHFGNDSTPLIFDLEERFEERRIVPPSPALAFLACLIEDMADEWGTKIMFEYRWRRSVDQNLVSRRLAYDMHPGGGFAETEAKAEAFKARQISRMPMVGCTEGNQPVIEASFHALLAGLESILTQRHYLFGTQPSLADFSLYGQLRQLNDDPTPRGVMQDVAPYTARWVDCLDDASGVSGDWIDGSEDDLDLLKPIIALAADVYLPFLSANAKAVATGAEEMRTQLLGMPYQQAPFKYQVKCFISLRQRYADLSESDKAMINPILAETGALAFLTQGASA